MRSIWILAAFAFAPFAVSAQLFAPPQPLMYRAAIELESPAAKTEHIRVSRYIPGARFPNSWDMLIEERKYDAQGRLVLWKRYDSFSGIRISEKTISWTPQGDRMEEKTWRAETQKEDVYIYKNSYDAAGKFQSAVITDAAAKPLGSVKLLPDGSRETTYINASNQRMVLVHDTQGRLLSSLDESVNSSDKYVYDATGEIIKVERMRAGKIMPYTYRSTRDDKGRIVIQDEILPEGQRRMFFEYDKAGNLISRKWDPSRPTEAYSFNAMRSLTDILQYTPEGFPKEVFAYMTDFYP